MAIKEITMPKLGESVTEGTINTWLVQVGDHVNKYDPIAEVMTDKVNAEVPSSFTGTIKQLIANEGDTLKVGELICTIEVIDSEEMVADTKLADTKEETLTNNKSQSGQSMKKRYSPAVLRLAQEHNIDLLQVEGSGRGGRITRKDIERIIASGKITQTTDSKRTQHVVEETKAISAIEKPTPSSLPDAQLGDKEIPVTGVRKVIADNMVRSKTEIPHAWMTVEVDVTDLVNYRNEVKESFKEKEGFNLTYFAFFVKAVAQALKEFPQMNSMWAGDKIIQKKDINLSIAVAKDNELFVPVIKHADDKSVKGIAKSIYELATKARTGKLTPDDMQGGTFTVNNTGSFGSVQSMGVINHPQAAILQVESIVERPVVVDGMIAVRHMVNLCLSLDHRILDGLVCGQFLARIKEILENMNKDTISIY